MVGRSEFFAAKAKHAQRPIPTQKAKPLDDSNWFHKGIVACQDLHGMTEGEFGIIGFAEIMDVSHDEADRRLRLLSRAGFLHMSVERAPSGDFIRYIWRLRDANLPRQTEIAEEI